jgi:hypothetical protein
VGALSADGGGAGRRCDRHALAAVPVGGGAGGTRLRSAEASGQASSASTRPLLATGTPPAATAAVLAADRAFTCHASAARSCNRSQ